MKHAVKTRRFGKTESHRNMMFRNLVTSLIKHGRVETTLPKAKELRSWGDKMITLGKRGDLHARRQALSVITEKEVVKKLFDEIAPLYQDREGGYTRVIRLGHRTGDAAPMAVIELVGKRGAEKKAAKTKKKKKKKEEK